MKRIILILLILATAFSLVSCANTEKPDWQTSLDLGQKYLLDGNYEQAIIEFNKVIEIEPKNVEAYLGLAEAYAAQGDYNSAIAALEQGYAETGNQSLQDKINELRGLAASQTEAVAAEVTMLPETTATPETVADLPTEPEREKTFFSANGYERYTYDEYGRCVVWLTGSLAYPYYQLVFSYDESGKVEKATFYSLSSVGNYFVNQLLYFDQNKVEAERLYYNDAGNLVVDFKMDESSAEFEFSDQMYALGFNLSNPYTHYSESYGRDESGRLTSGTVDMVNADTAVSSRFEIIYDENGLPESSTIQYENGMSVNYAFSFEEGLLKNVICNFEAPSYPEGTWDMSDEGIWNAVYDDNKKLVKGNMKSYSYYFDQDGNMVPSAYPSENVAEYEYDSDGKLSRIKLTLSYTGTGADYTNSMVYEYEYEHTPYLTLKNVILPDNTHYSDTQNDSLVTIYYVVNNGHSYVANAAIDKEFFIPAESEKYFKNLYIDGVQLVESVDYIISDEIILLYASAFAKIDVLSEDIHTIATEFRNESDELLFRKALNIRFDTERLRN